MGSWRRRRHLAEIEGPMFGSSLLWGVRKEQNLEGFFWGVYSKETF